MASTCASAAARRLLGAEPWSEAMRGEIESTWNMLATDIYGLSEIMGPGVAMECTEARDGMHIFEDHFLVETINPKTGEVLSPGRRRGTGLYHANEETFPLFPDHTA